MFRHRAFAKCITALAMGALVAACNNASRVTDASRVLPLEDAGPNAGFPAVTLSPTSLSFGYVYPSTTSQPKLVTLTNSGTATLTIKSIVVSGPFIKNSTTCPATLARAAKCSISVSFRPPYAHPFTGSLAVSDNASGSPQTVLLAGTGVIRSLCLRQGSECYPPLHCCPGLVCVAFSIRAYCEPSGSSAGRYSHIDQIIAESNPDSVSVIDVKKGALIKSIAVGGGAASVAITPDGDKIYVANRLANSVSVIDTRKNVVTKTINVGFGTRPMDVEMAANGLEAFISSSVDNTVSVIDTTTDTAEKPLPVGVLPNDIATIPRCSNTRAGSRDGNVIYTINSRGNTPSDSAGPPDEVASLYGGR